MKANYLILLSVSIFLVSCANSDKENDPFYNLKKVREGMHIKEVDSIMGTPDSIFVDPLNDRLFRYMYNASFGMSDNMYIMFSIDDSTVKSINDGQ